MLFIDFKGVLKNRNFQTTLVKEGGGHIKQYLYSVYALHNVDNSG